MKIDKDFHKAPYWLLSSTTFSPNEKLVLISMLSDYAMNGKVKWSQNQYAGKTGCTRKYVNGFFKLCIQKSILRPNSENTKGSVYNTFQFNFDLVERMAQRNDKKLFRPVTLKDKPVTPEVQTCNPGGQTCNPGGTDLLPAVTHIDSIDLTNSKDLYRGEDDVSSSSSPKGEKDPEETMQELILELNTEI